MTRLRLLLAAVAAAAAVAAVAGAAAAAPARAAQFSIVPVGSWPKGYFVVDGRPGATIHDAILVTNVGGAAGTVRLSGVDATTGRTSGAVYLDGAVPRRAVGGWIALGKRELRLAPHQTVRVPVVVSVPRDVAPGEHVGGLVAEPTQVSAPVVHPGKRGALAIRIRQLSIVAFQVNVPGPRVYELAVTSASSGRSNGYQWLYLGLRNDGNTMVKPHGQVVVRDAAGAVVEKVSFALDTFLPHTAIRYPVVVRGRSLPPGRYSAAIQLGVGAAVPVRKVLPLEVASDSTAKLYRSPKPDFGQAHAKQPPRAAAPAPATAPARRGHRRGVPWAAAGAGLALCLLLLGLGVRRRRRTRTEGLEAVARRAAELVLAGLSEQATASPFATVAEAAELLGCSPQRVHRLLSAGRLERHKDGRRTFVRRAEVEALLADAPPPRRSAA